MTTSTEPTLDRSTLENLLHEVRRLIRRYRECRKENEALHARLEELSNEVEALRDRIRQMEAERDAVRLQVAELLEELNQLDLD